LKTNHLAKNFSAAGENFPSTQLDFLLAPLPLTFPLQKKNDRHYHLEVTHSKIEQHYIAAYHL
jgi:hypothetical protein